MAILVAEELLSRRVEDDRGTRGDHSLSSAYSLTMPHGRGFRIAFVSTSVEQEYC